MRSKTPSLTINGKRGPAKPRPGKNLAFAPLSDLERENLRGWVEIAFDQAVHFNGSQTAEEDLIESLAALEKIFNGVVTDHQNLNRDDIEAAIIESLDVGRAIPRTIDSFLSVASEFYHRLETANNFETSLNILERAGVPVVHTHDLHIPPGEGEIQNALSEDPTKFKIETQPRLAWLVAAMKEKGIFTSDIMITVGQTPKNIMRQHPYVIIDIPYVPCQIAVCDQVGERTFITNKIYEMDFWKNFNKDLLKATQGVTGIICRSQDQWIRDILDHIEQMRAPESQRVDMKAFAATPTRAKMPITLEAIEQSIRATYDASGKWPGVRNEIIMYGPLKDQIKWGGIDARFKKGNYEGYISLADFMEKKGFRKNHLNIEHYTFDDIVDSIQATYDATDKWPAHHYGVIEYGALKDLITWAALHQRFKNGKYEGYSSLADFMEKKGFKKNYFNIEHYPLDDIKDSIQATFDVTGKWPAQHHGMIMIEYGVLKNKITWIALNRRFRSGKYEGYKSLAEFRDKVKAEYEAALSHAPSPVSPPAPFAP